MEIGVESRRRNRSAGGELRPLASRRRRRLGSFAFAKVPAGASSSIPAAAAAAAIASSQLTFGGEAGVGAGAGSGSRLTILIFSGGRYWRRVSSNKSPSIGFDKYSTKPLEIYISLMPTIALAVRTIKGILS